MKSSQSPTHGETRNRKETESERYQAQGENDEQDELAPAEALKDLKAN